MSDRFDVLVVGRVGVDLYPLDLDRPLAEVSRFAKFLGGSAANVAVACARLGRSTALVTRTGRDGFAPFIHSELQRYGVDDRYISPVDGINTPVHFCEVHPPDDFPLLFYRAPKAPDLVIYEQELDFEAIESCGVFWTTVTGLSQEPSRSAHFAAWEKRARRSHTILDLDWRASFWDSAEQARGVIAQALEHVNVVIGNAEECRVATGHDNPEHAARAMVDRGVDLAIVKQGPHGVLAMTATESIHIPAFPITVVNGLGAGDGFGGAICHGLLSGWDLVRTVTFATMAGAMVAEHLECSGAMPTEDEVLTRLKEHAV